jgi:VWFA-related protein
VSCLCRRSGPHSRTRNAVRGLTKDDFTLLDDRAPQSITSATFVDLSVESPVMRANSASAESDIATNRGTGRLWVLLISNSFGRPSERTRLVARRFVEEAFGPNDQAAVIPVNGNMSAAQGFTRSRTLLLAAINRLSESESAFPEFMRARNGFEVLEDVCRRLGVIAGRRKSVVYFDPPSLVIPEDQKDVNLYFDQRDALRAATRNNVAVYAVSTSGLSAEPGSTLMYDAGVRLLSE